MHDAFLSDIIANPDDDTPRLVYADWLDENGDPERARFIRVQCRLAAMGQYDPERDELEDEQAALLATNGKKWLKPLAKITTNVQFRRGFPHRFALPAAKFAAKGEAAFAAAPTLRDYRVLQPKKGWDELLACPALEKVASFDASGHRLTVASVRAMGRSPHFGKLQELDLTWSSLSSSIVELAGSPCLSRPRKLMLTGCGIRDAGLEALLRGRSATPLTSLSLLNNELTAAGIGHLARWGGAPQLETLFIGEE
jgi:uncharacterized protein (TIGR02996 family)